MQDLKETLQNIRQEFASRVARNHVPSQILLSLLCDLAETDGGSNLRFRTAASFFLPPKPGAWPHPASPAAHPDVPSKAEPKSTAHSDSDP